MKTSFLLLSQVSSLLCHHNNQQHQNTRAQRLGTLPALLLSLYLVAGRVFGTVEVLRKYQLDETVPHNKQCDIL